MEKNTPTVTVVAPPPAEGTAIPMTAMGEQPAVGLPAATPVDEKASPVVKGQLPMAATPVVNVKTPKVTVMYIVKVGMAKGEMSPVVIFLLGFLAGLMIGHGALAAFIVIGGANKGAGSLGDLSPGIAKFLGACNFPVVLMMILICGGELFTGNCMYLPAALMAGKVTVLKAAKSWYVE
jgi:hypothetical protein